MAYVDRGGGRESKNHERRVKRGLAAKANPFAKKDSSAAAAVTESPLPSAIAAEHHTMSLVDCGVNILSRQLGREQSRMLQRAVTEHVDASICFTTDFDKVQELVTTIKAYPGQLYGAYGVHPDNIKRANEKTFASKVAELRSLALTPECVAIFCGLDFGRDMASHYPQQKMVQDHLKLAADVRLPVLVAQVSAGERLAEILGEFTASWVPPAVDDKDKDKEKDRDREKDKDKERDKDKDRAAAGAGSRDGAGGKGKAAKPEETNKTALPPWKPRAAVLAFDGDEKALVALLEAGAYIVIDGLLCEDSPEGEALRSIVHKIPLDKLLIMSNSPLHTPQNIPDHYIRSTRNEPSNMPFLLPKLCECYNAAAPAEDKKLTTSVLAQQIFANSAFFFQFSASAASGTAAKARGADAGAKSAPGASKEETGEAEAAGTAERKDGEAAPATAAGEREAMDPDDDAPVFAHNGVQFRCKMCRFPLFTDADVMSHGRNFIRASARTKAQTGEGEEEESEEEDEDGKSVGSSGSDVSDDDLLTFIGGRSMAPGKKGGARTIRYYGETGTVMEIDDSGGVSASRWHTAKGRTVKLSGETGCRMLLVDRQTWMDYAPTEPEGSILCPGCSYKLGLYNLGGLKCSCGLKVAPAYKIPKNRVDAALLGVDILEATMAGLDLHARGAIEEGDDEEEEDSDEDEERVRERRKKVPVSKHRGNFSEFRNKTT